MALTYIFVSIAVGLYIVRKYRESFWGNYSSKDTLIGKVFLITGANSGVGKEAARQLLQRHATIIMGNRDAAKTREAIEDLRKTTSFGEIVTIPLDLASFRSIKEFAKEINEKFSRIDVLINNAGVAVPLNKDLRTEENFELNIGVNHLGHFLLTNLLLKKLKSSAPSRIVIVSSTLHERGNIDLDDLNLDKLRATGVNPRFSPGYCNSKLANAYHGRELAEQLKDDQVDVRLLCPGFTYTGLHRYSSVSWWQFILFLPVAFLFMRSAKQGARTIVYCATEKNLPGKSGDFYRDCTLYQSKANFENDIQKKLWAKSEELTSSLSYAK